MDRFGDVPSEVNALGFDVIGLAIETQGVLGPGLLENVYRVELEERLRRRGLTVTTEVPIYRRGPDGVARVGCRIDLLVNDQVAVELKSVAAIELRHVLQLKSYLRLAELPLGYVLNFGPPRLGIKRVVPTTSAFSGFLPFRDFGSPDGDDEAFQ